MVKIFRGSFPPSPPHLNFFTSSIDLTDNIYSYVGEYSVTIRVLETTDKVTFFSKEKLLTDGIHSNGVNYGKGYAPQKNVWPNISFQ